MSIHILFMILALVSFVLAAIEANVPRVSLTPLGLAFLVLAMMV